MMEFSGDDVINLLKKKVADLSLEVELYRQYAAQLEQQLQQATPTMDEDDAGRNNDDNPERA